MRDGDAGLLARASAPPRILGRIRGARPGPTIIALGGIHGNEPAGVHAARRVVSRLERARPPLRGDFIALSGNRRALEIGTRFVDRDLNRNWTDVRLRALPADPGAVTSCHEDAEQRDLFDRLTTLSREAGAGEVYFLDLHTSSAEGAPFTTIGDTLRHRSFALEFPLPVVLGLEEQINDSLLEYMNALGHVTLGVEAGRHDHPGSVDRHEAVLWLALRAAGLLDPEHIPDLEAHRRLLAESVRGLPRIVEVLHRHVVSPDDRFRMEPGFGNFSPVERGRLLAADRRGEIRALRAGLILLPLYQGQGDDGFFLCRAVRPLWLRISALLRRLRLGSLLHLLPGVARHPDRPQTLVVDTRIARFYPMEFFHLLGYRKLRREGTRLVVSRRLHDTGPPRRRPEPQDR